MTTATVTPKTFGIHSRMEVERAEVRMDIYGTPEVKRALYLVNHSRQTSRISGNAEMAIRKLSGYQFAKLVISLIGKDGYEVASYINNKYAEVQ